MARGRIVPVARLSMGKKMNFMKIKINMIEKSQPFQLLSFHSKCQNFFHISFAFMTNKRGMGFYVLWIIVSFKNTLLWLRV